MKFDSNKDIYVETSRDPSSGRARSVIASYEYIATKYSGQSSAAKPSDMETLAEKILRDILDKSEGGVRAVPTYVDGRGNKVVILAASAEGAINMLAHAISEGLIEAPAEEEKSHDG